MSKCRMSSGAPTAISVTLLMVAATSSGCMERPAAATEAGSRGEDARRAVEVHTVGTGDVVDSRGYFAGVEASSRVTLYPLMSERILELAVEDGDEVKAGQVIARIRSASLKKSIAQMNAEIESIDSTITNQERDLERSRELFETRIVTRQGLDLIESTYQSTVAKRRALEASRGQISVTAQNAIVKAPMDGVVTGKTLEVGDIAQPQVPLCDLVAVDPVRMHIGVTERDAAMVLVGMAVELTVDAHPDRVFAGEITKILPVLDPITRTNEIRVEIPNPIDGATGTRPLKPGMFGRARIILGTHRGATVVPARALVLTDDAEGAGMDVFVVGEDGVARRRRVAVGRRSGDLYEVASGLEAGERAGAGAGEVRR